MENDKAKTTMSQSLSTLYILEQKISIFKEEFASEYMQFITRIENIRKEYLETLEKSKVDLTYEINPEKDGKMLGKILKLEADINRFVEKDIKFNFISKQLQNLITKLNILYNVSIFHSKEEEKKKVIAQTERAKIQEKRLVEQFEKNNYLIEDIQINERFATLISYIDYEIFKVSMRNSTQKPDEITFNKNVKTELEEKLFKAFMEEELTNIKRKIEQIKDAEDIEVINKYFDKIECYLANTNKILLEDTGVWKNLLKLEDTIIEILILKGVDKDLIKIDIISKMNINVKEEEVLNMPKETAYLALINIYSKTTDERIFLVLKFLKNISSNITYKEIYFILVLFDAIDIVKDIPNELNIYMYKYIKKYPYSDKKLQKRKKKVFKIKNKQYQEIFTLKEYEPKVLKTLEELEIDFLIDSNKVFINEFYFKGLNNVTKSLQAKTKR